MPSDKLVLIADDDRDLVNLLSIHCRHLGLLVDSASDAITALRKIDDSQPDVVVLDVSMPRGNGLSVREMMTADERLAKIPVIMLTGRSDEETIRRCHMTCAFYVEKSPDVWQRIEPLLRELSGLGSPQNATPEARNSNNDEGELGRIGLTADPQLDRPPDGSAELSQKENEAGERRRPVLDTPTPATFKNEADMKRTTPLLQATARPATLSIAGNSPAALPSTDDKPEPRPGLIDSVFAMLGSNETYLEGEEAPQVEEQKSQTPWVLCIDDDADLSLSYKLHLQKHGIEVLRAFAGMAGYRNAFLNKPQAIILDFELPEGNGDYVLGRLKENPITRDIPVIVLTGRRERSLERKMYALGANEFLNKPCPFPLLWEKLQKYIEVPAI